MRTPSTPCTRAARTASTSLMPNKRPWLRDSTLPLPQQGEARCPPLAQTTNLLLTLGPSVSHHLPPHRMRRPLSAMPRSRQLSATVRAIDEVLNASPPRHSPPGARAAHHNADAPTVSSRWQRLVQQMPDHDSVLGPGFMAAGSGTGSGSIGRYHQILPSPEGKERARYLKIFATASDAFPDQRCGCSWCSRRLRVRHMASTAMEIFAVTGNHRHRPFSASPLVGSGANAVRSPSTAVRSLSQMSYHSPQKPSGEPAKTEFSEGVSYAPSSAFKESGSSPTCKPPRPSGRSPLVFNPAMGGGGGGQPSNLQDSPNEIYAARQGDGGSMKDSGYEPEENASSSLPHSTALLDLSSKMDRHLARYLKALHSSCPR